MSRITGVKLKMEIKKSSDWGASISRSFWTYRVQGWKRSLLFHFHFSTPTGSKVPSLGGEGRSSLIRVPNLFLRAKKKHPHYPRAGPTSDGSKSDMQRAINKLKVRCFALLGVFLSLFVCFFKKKGLIDTTHPFFFSSHNNIIRRTVCPTPLFFHLSSFLVFASFHCSLSLLIHFHPHSFYLRKILILILFFLDSPSSIPPSPRRIIAHPSRYETTSDTGTDFFVFIWT